MTPIIFRSKSDLAARRGRHHHAFLFLMLMTGPALEVCAAEAGRIEYVTSNVTIRSGDGAGRIAVKGDRIETGDTILTGTGRIQLRMIDQAYIALQQETEFRVDAYTLPDTGKEESGLMFLVKGGLRTITGLIGQRNRSAYGIKTATATIGIRGTEFAASSESADGTRVSVTEGIVALCSGGGCIDINPGQSGHAPLPNVRPTLSFTPPRLSPPAAEMPAGFAIGENRDADGKPALLSGVSSTSSASAQAIIPIGIGVTTGGLGAAFSNASSFTAGLLGNQQTFDASGALIAYSDCCGWGLSAGMPADFGADGIIAWGRWTGGNSTHPTVNGPMTSLNYYATLSSLNPTVPSIVRAYASFASTAPTIFSGGVITDVGTANSVTGSMNVNFPSTSGGTLTYALNVPIAGQTFSISGNANQFNTYGFLGSSSTIVSSGAGCAGGCTGAIPFGNAIQGSFTGTGAERAGANYGFNSALGKVSGAIVFK